MKKLLFVISTLNTGGAQRAFANMSIGFPEEWQCDFLLNDAQSVTYPYRGNIISLGLTPKEDKGGLLYQCRVFWKRYWKLRSLKRSGQYEACISALTSANAVNVLTGRRYCKTIISIRIYMSQILRQEKKYIAWIETWVIRHLSNIADYVVSVSESARLDLINHFGVKPQKTRTIYNGYAIEQMHVLAAETLTVEEEQWFRFGKRQIVTMGRLDEQKGQFHLIRAFQRIHEKCPDTVLLILGNGKLEIELRALITELRLEEVVILCGFVKNPYKIMARSNIFILSSLFEGFPNALAESLCLDSPVVSTDCDSGAREILAPSTDIFKKVNKGFEKAEYGILCPVCDGKLRGAKESLTEEEEALAEGILYLLGDEEIYQYYKNQCRQRAKQLHIEESVKKWMELVNA